MIIMQRIFTRTVIVGTSYDLDLSMMLAPAMDSVAAAKPPNSLRNMQIANKILFSVKATNLQWYRALLPNS